MDGFVYSFRLGLGAKFVPHSNINATVTPIEKKLRAKLQTSKPSKDVIPCKNGEPNVEHDVSKEEEDSKSSFFSNKDMSKSSKAHLIQEFRKGGKKRKTRW